MLRVVKGLKIESEEIEGVRQEVMLSCISVRRKVVECKRIIWKSLRMKKLIVIIMSREMQ